MARRVTHQNVARTYDIGSEDDVLFLTMEYVDGSPLSSLIRDEAPLDVPHVLSIAAQICEGLDAAHQAEVLHRDLKPQNVMMREDGQAVFDRLRYCSRGTPG